jgi:methylated-DNA-[protein]-cysteine S-methyltransferase
MQGIYTKELGSVWFGVACDEKQVYATTFTFNEKAALKSLLGSIPSYIHFQHSKQVSGFAEQVIAVLKEFYDGNGESFRFSLAMEHLPDYTRSVLEATSLIPLGYAASYGSIAEATGGGARAVGNIMASNPFPPIVPCHRVVRSDLTLGGYGGGLDLKLQILEREKRGFDSKLEIPVKDKKLSVFPIEFVLKRLKKG